MQDQKACLQSNQTKGNSFEVIRMFFFHSFVLQTIISFRIGENYPHEFQLAILNQNICYLVSESGGRKKA